jgi:alginate O-acetyltransferase complex protein AlgI
MFAFDFKPTLSFDVEFYTFFILAGFFAFFTMLKKGQQIQDAVFINDYSTQRHITLSLVTVVLFVISISTITTFGFNPFIYFRF